MRRPIAWLLIAAIAFSAGACRKQPEGAVKVVVIGGEPKLRDPAQAPLGPGDEVLLANVAQGLVRFDAAGNIVGGLAERWNVSDDGLSYLFRIASANWPDGRKITADQVARALKRSIGPRSKNPLKDSLGAIDDAVAMTDRVIEIRLLAPRPSLLSLLAQPAMGVIRNGQGSGPFTAAPSSTGELRLTREIVSPDDESTSREEVLLTGATAVDAVRQFAAAKSDLVLGGTFDDLPDAQRANLARGALHFDPASGLFGLVPAREGSPLDKPEIRQLLSQAIDRDALVAALQVPNLVPRATLLEPGLDGISPPPVPAWTATPFADRFPALQAQAAKLFPKTSKPAVRVSLSDGPGSDLLFRLLARDWGALGFTVERSQSAANADFVLIDEVAPSASPAWFVRHFRCGTVPVCDSQADELMDAARLTPVSAQRYALLVQAAARIDDAELFLPLTAPVRWSLASRRIAGFAGNRFARHTLTGLEQNSSGGD